MPETRITPHLQGDRYQITAQGILDNSWTEWLGDLQISTARDGSGDPMTLIRGSFKDQAALRGVLAKLWDLNVILIGVQRINPRTEEPTKWRIEK